jgi:beta-galactosidase GanA
MNMRGNKMSRTFLTVGLLTACGLNVGLQAQVKERPIPRLTQKDGRYALEVDGAPFLMLGVQANNSSAWPAMLPKVWPAVEYLRANTLEIPIYWEQFEPKPGRFNYTVIDTILTQAREHRVRLVLLWFGTWKNGSQHYMPEWMKLDPARYLHVIDRNGRPADSPSPFATASLEADIRAFAAFMRHLKAADPQRTVVMVQVENEPGTWGTLRDYSPVAQKLFEAPVPADVLRAMNKDASGPAASWQDVFGPEAEVCFHAWSVAVYVGKVAAAGKAAYPLPLYTNAALRDPIKPGAPGTYESGGPTDNVIPIWKVAAPALDLVAPDIYMNESAQYLKVLELYHRDDNPLFVPETSGSAAVARFFFSALGLQAIGFSPFGLDYARQTRAPQTGDAGRPEEFLEPTARNYRLIAPMMRDVARLNFEGKLQAVAEEKGKTTRTLQFGPWNAIVSYGASRNNRAVGNPEPVGRVLAARIRDNQFLVAGFFCRIDFSPADGDKRRQFLRVEEGTYENGSFKFIRILNGDQTDWGLNFGSEPQVLRVSLATY